MDDRIASKKTGRFCFNGFTLIELLVVIAILIPALQIVKRKAPPADQTEDIVFMAAGWTISN